MTEPTAPTQPRCLKVHPFRAIQAHRPYLAVPSATDRRWHLRCEDCDELVCERRHEPFPYTRGSAILAIAIPARLRCAVDATWRPDGHDATPLWPQVHFEVPDDLPAKWRTSRPPRWYIWAILYRRQRGRCAACQSAPPAVVDHAHWNRQVRGLLCAACNTREWTCKHDPHCLDEYLAAPPAREFGWVYSSNKGVAKRDKRPSDPAYDSVRPKPEVPAAKVLTRVTAKVPATEAELRAEIRLLVGRVAHREGLDHQAVNTQILQAGYPPRQNAQVGGLLRIREYLVKRVAKPVRLGKASPEDIVKQLARLTPKRRAEIAEQVECEQADRMRRWDAIAEEAGRDPAPDPEEYSRRLTVAYDRWFPETNHRRVR